MQWCRRASQKLVGASMCTGSLFWDELDELSVAVWAGEKEKVTNLLVCLFTLFSKSFNVLSAELSSIKENSVTQMTV